MEGMIDVTGINLVEAVKAAYDLSVPQGMGFLHAKPGSLTDDEAAQLVRADHPHYPISLDYVRGRACKFTVHRRDDRLWINANWFDHSRSQLSELLSRVGIKAQP